MPFKHFELNEPLTNEAIKEIGGEVIGQAYVNFHEFWGNGKTRKAQYPKTNGGMASFSFMD